MYVVCTPGLPGVLFCAAGWGRRSLASPCQGRWVRRRRSRRGSAVESQSLPPGGSVASAASGRRSEPKRVAAVKIMELQRNEHYFGYRNRRRGTASAVDEGETSLLWNCRNGCCASYTSSVGCADTFSSRRRLGCEADLEDLRNKRTKSNPAKRGVSRSAASGGRSEASEWPRSK